MNKTTPDNIGSPPPRAPLAEQSGPTLWRSLDELIDAPDFEQRLEAEFPLGAEFWKSGVSRRGFLKMMGASLALAGIGTGCTRQPDERIVPYVEQPEYLVPGKPLYFATSHLLDGFARGVLVESHMGRPTKIEGNPEHPAAPAPADAPEHGTRIGPADIFALASILDLYDPDRSQAVRREGQIDSWDAFVETLRVERDRLDSVGGRGLRILTPTITSPTFGWQMEKLAEAYPQARWHQYQPINRDNRRAGAIAAFGRDVEPVHHLERADVIVSIDCDFLSGRPDSVRLARAFSQRRDTIDDPARMNRLYVVEPMPTPTGISADHRLSVSSQEASQVALALASRLGVRGANAPSRLDVDPGWLDAVAADLRQHAGRAVVMAGDPQPPEVHALVFAINEALDAAAGPEPVVEYIEPPIVKSEDQRQSIARLTHDMAMGEVDTLLILGCNPVYNAPADVKFVEAMEQVGLRVHMGMHFDETAAWCHWHLPAAHMLESWSDARATDGTASIVQPLIAPLYDGHSMHDVLAVLLERPLRTSYQLVREYWENQFAQTGSGESFDRWWRRVLHDGLVPDSTNQGVPGVEVTLRPINSDTDLLTQQSRGIELLLRPDPTIRDGDQANNGWLQETPKPVTKLTWTNAALMSKALADASGIKDGDTIVLSFSVDDGSGGGRMEHRVEPRVKIVPGHAANSITLHLGYGRHRVGHIGNGLGVNAYSMLTTTHGARIADVSVRVLGASNVDLPDTQKHHDMHHRDIVRTSTLAAFLDDRKVPPVHHGSDHDMGVAGSAASKAQGDAPIAYRKEDGEVALSLYENYDYTQGAKWGMSIDLTKCIGCNACITGCQSENNIPIVGPEQVAVGREMHWIRVDHYFEGDAIDPDMHFQPVTCMHCEKAPCEVVCPVGATMHSDEGLNEMVYNRCIGTRYCSNNCPYKVRRFNFLEYHRPMPESVKLMQNPDVTVRQRGVMEKCTYCVQRISAARIEAKKEQRPIRDGEVAAACESACPTQAIVFGDMNDPGSRIAKRKEQQHDYGLLTELNTIPRTTYLAKVRNVNPRLIALAHDSAEGHDVTEGGH